MADDLRERSRELLDELEHAEGWDFEERTSPTIVNVNLPAGSAPKPSHAPSWQAGLSPKQRTIVGIVLAILTALGALRELL